MRYFINLLSAAGIALFIATSIQAETISPQEASHYVGNAITVEGLVSQVSTSGGGTTFITLAGVIPTMSSMLSYSGKIRVDFLESMH